MIVRILGEGQFEVDQRRLEGLNELDEEVVAAIERGDDRAFRDALDALLAGVRDAGTRVPDERLAPSELVLPPPDATLEEVRALLGEEGLVPG